MARIVFSLLFPRLHRLRGVAACVRRAVHGWQRGWERGRWLARLILSAAEMVRPLSAPSILFVSSCLASPFSHPPRIFPLFTFSPEPAAPRHRLLAPSPRFSLRPSSPLYLAARHTPLFPPPSTPTSEDREGGGGGGGWPKPRGGCGTRNAWLATLLDAPDESVRPGVDDDAARATLIPLFPRRRPEKRDERRQEWGSRVMRRKDGAHSEISRARYAREKGIVAKKRRNFRVRRAHTPRDITRPPTGD